MKKTFFLATVLALAILCAYACADVTKSYPENGATLSYPDAFSGDRTKGVFVTRSEGDTLGISGMDFLYYALPMDRYKALRASIDGTSSPAEEQEYFTSQWPLANLYSIDRGRKLEDLLKVLEAHPGMESGFFELAVVEDITFYAYIYPDDPELQQMAPDYREEFLSLGTALAEVLKQGIYTRPVPAGSELVGTRLSFETTDIAGNPVKSTELFSKNKITLINIWATNCYPCVMELPELAKLNHDLAEKQVGIIGFCLDADTKPEECIEILTEKGVDFPTLLPFAGMSKALPISGTPTTYFVDGEGTVLSPPLAGVDLDRVEGQYLEMIDSLLKASTVSLSQTLTAIPWRMWPCVSARTLPAALVRRMRTASRSFGRKKALSTASILTMCPKVMRKTTGNTKQAGSSAMSASPCRNDKPIKEDIS